jgi:tetratricopeptide (TPR) repeat protein
MPRTAGQHVDNPAAVGTRLRLARERLGLSQRELSFDGCSYAYISRIESGQRIPSMQLLQQFGRRLGVSARYLATGADAPDTVDLLDEADLARRLGDEARADKLYREISEDAKSAPARRARANVGLGELAFQSGKFDAAALLFERALASGAIDPAGAAASADRLGRIYALRGEFEKSIAIYEQALTQAETSGDKSDLMRFATLLANAVLDAGNLGRAQELLGRALTIAEQVQNPLDRARLWWTQSRLHDSQGQPDLAARYARLALAVLEEEDQTAAAGVAHLLLAYIENERGDADAALESLDRAERTIGGGSDRFHQALLQIERARALLLKGEQEQAASLAMGALPHVLQASAIDSGRAQALLGDVFRELGDRERAQELYELALETLPSVDSNLVRVYGGLAALLEEDGRELEALELLKQAMKLRQTRRAPIESNTPRVY